MPATFTMELRKVAEIFPNWIEKYPIFDEEYRPELDKKIFDEFMFREIGFETPEMFINRFNHRMRVTMPYFNKLYTLFNTEFDPLVNYLIETTGKTLSISDISRLVETADTRTDNLDSLTKTIANDTHIGKNSVERDAINDSTNATGSQARSVNSQFPQTMLSDNGDYATSANDTNSKSSVTSNVTENAKEIASVNDNRDSVSDVTQNDTQTIKADGTQKRTGFNRDDENRNSITKGRNMSPMTLIKQYYENIINVDELLLKRLDSLFMLVFNTEDDYVASSYGFDYSDYGMYGGFRMRPFGF